MTVFSNTTKIGFCTNKLGKFLGVHSRLPGIIYCELQPTTTTITSMTLLLPREERERKVARQKAYICVYTDGSKLEYKVGEGFYFKHL